MKKLYVIIAIVAIYIGYKWYTTNNEVTSSTDVKKQAGLQSGALAKAKANNLSINPTSYLAHKIA